MTNAEAIVATVTPIVLFLGAISYVTLIASLLLPGPFSLSQIVICEKAYNKETVFLFLPP